MCIYVLVGACEREAQAEVERPKVLWEKNDAADWSERTVLRVRKEEEVGVLMPTLDLFIFDKSSEFRVRYPAKFRG